MAGTYFWLEISVRKATKLTILIDVIFGSIGIFASCCYLNFLQNDRTHPLKNNSSAYIDLSQAWIPFLFLVCSGIEMALAVVLTCAVYIESIRLCYVYLLLSFTTCTFTILFIFRFYLMLVVVEFIVFLKNKRKRNTRREYTPTVATVSMIVDNPAFVNEESEAIELPQLRRSNSWPSCRVVCTQHLKAKQMASQEESDKPPSYIKAINMPKF